MDLSVPFITFVQGSLPVCVSRAKMGKRTFPSILLLAALLLVVLQHAVTTAVPLRGPAGKPMKLTPGKVSATRICLGAGPGFS